MGVTSGIGVGCATSGGRSTTWNVCVVGSPSMYLMAAGVHVAWEDSEEGSGDPQTSNAAAGGENRPHHAQATCACSTASSGAATSGSGPASSPTSHGSADP